MPNDGWQVRGKDITNFIPHVLLESFPVLQVVLYLALYLEPCVLSDTLEQPIKISVTSKYLGLQ